MPVIGHHAPRQNAHRQSLLGLGDHLLEGLEVALPGENPHPPHGPIEHMVYISAAGNPQSSRHGAKIPSSLRPVNVKTPDPFTLRLGSRADFR